MPQQIAPVPPEDSLDEKPSWLPSKATVVAAAAFVAGGIKAAFGLDLGTGNVANIGIAGTLIASGSWLGWRTIKRVLPIIRAWQAARNGGTK